MAFKYGLCREPPSFEADGFSHGETKGDIVGYDMLNGTNYGGSDDPLPRGARAAFVLAKIGETTDDWQEVLARKGKRGRS